MSSSSSKKITLKSSNEVVFKIDEAVAMHMKMIKQMIEDYCATNTIPLPNVTDDILSKVIEYSKVHVESDAVADSTTRDDNEKKLKAFDTELVNVVDHNELFGLVGAANDLNVKGLKDLACNAVADMIQHSSAQEIRKIFKLHDDFTPEEEEEIRRANRHGTE